MFVSIKIKAFVFGTWFWIPTNKYKNLGEKFSKTSFQLWMELKKGQKWCRDEKNARRLPYVCCVFLQMSASCVLRSLFCVCPFSGPSSGCDTEGGCTGISPPQEKFPPCGAVYAILCYYMLHYTWACYYLFKQLIIKSDIAHTLWIGYQYIVCTW